MSGNAMNLEMNSLKVAVALFRQAFASQSTKHIQILNGELQNIVGESFVVNEVDFDQSVIDYNSLQEKLSKLNERGPNRKRNGVYFTPNDTAHFIVVNTIKLYMKQFQENAERILKSRVLDPTCGVGEFLLECYRIKFETAGAHISKKDVASIVASIYGNDLDRISICVCKIRILAFLAVNTKIENLEGISEILNQQFSDYDAIYLSKKIQNTFDIIVGNPPYVEDGKYSGTIECRYGNIYANVLVESAALLEKDGTIGFVIPISYVATPRMKKLREELRKKVPNQYLLNFADRPDCLFSSVHQKLTIIIGQQSDTVETYTSQYNFWFENERSLLFNRIRHVKNEFVQDEFIPKLGNNTDVSLYKKIQKQSQKLNALFVKGTSELHLNMRLTFWVKAFSQKQDSEEYKRFQCKNEKQRDFALCVLNSSLFWWFWCAVSDCWHITNKELDAFKIPAKIEFSLYKRLREDLELALEKTKKYIGSKQTSYEYKHRLCLQEIHAIDDVVNRAYGLTQKESDYLKNFALKYRAGGNDNESC
jgi:hypothetical protein